MVQRRFGIFDLANYAFLALLSVLALLPFLNVLAESLSTEEAIILGKVSVLPVGWNLLSYRYVLGSRDFLQAFLVQTTVTVGGTLLAIVLTCLMAYPLSRRNLWGKSAVLIVVVITMIFDAGLVPNYMLLRSLRFTNTLLALIVPLAFSGFNMFIVRSYMQTIPESVIESATMDGAGHLRVLLQIVVPFSIPVLATICLYYAVAYWNDYFSGMIYITQHALKPMQQYLREIIYEALDPMGSVGARQDADSFLLISPISVRAATIVASTIPILCVYPLLQRYYIKGIMIGSVKE
jgi:putative aldouronate transport system permease protein